MKNTHISKARLAMLNHKGFTLVEVLIALLVLGILFVPVSNAFLQSVHFNQYLHQRVAAVRETQTAMEMTLSLMRHVQTDQQIETQINELLADVGTSHLIGADTTMEIAPFDETNHFYVITATSTGTNTSTKGSSDIFTLITLHLPGEIPWLTPKEFRVVTP